MDGTALPQQMSFSCRVRTTPFTSRVEALGVTAYSVYNHMLLPVTYRSMAEDYWHLREHVQVWDVAAQRQVELRGPDAARLLQLMTPRDLTQAAVGRCLYTPLVDAAGGVVNDPVVLVLSEDRFWISVGDADVLLWADGLATGMGLDVEVSEPDVWPLAVQGPRSEELVTRVFGEAPRALGFFRFVELELDGHPLRVARTGWSRQGGFEVYVDDAEVGGRLWDALMDAGADLGVGPGAPNLAERIEGGLLSYGADMTRANTPYECNFDRWCQLERDIEVLGRAALERAAAAGPTQRIRGLRVDADELPPCRTPWPVVAGDGRRVGQVTSAVVSPASGRGVAIGMLDAAHWAPGTSVEVLVDGAALPATVAELPLTA